MKKLFCLFVLLFVALTVVYAKQRSGEPPKTPSAGTVINLGPCPDGTKNCFLQKYAVVYSVNHAPDKSSAIPCKGEAACSTEIKMELFYTLDDLERRLKPRDDVTILDNGGAPVGPGSSDEVNKDDLIGIYALTPVSPAQVHLK